MSGRSAEGHASEDRAGLTVRVQPPAVVLETAFLTAGLPKARRAEAVERIIASATGRGATPAFAAILKGKPVIGLNGEEIAWLGAQRGKASTRDLASVVSRGGSAGTTVAATVFLAGRAGLPVVATGGIGGVHPRPGPPDVSADLFQLARTAVVLVSSGPKAFVDPVATFERLESLGVTVLAYGSDELPCFWTRDTGLPARTRIDTAEEAAEIWEVSQRLGQPGAVLVCVPPPEGVALSKEESERAVGKALRDLEMAGVTGPGVTPYLLARIAAYTDGRSVETNLALLANNARLAAEISVRCSEIGSQ